MVRALRWPRGAISLLVVIIVSLGPCAHGVEWEQVEEVPNIDSNGWVPSPVKEHPDAQELLSNIDGFFTENLGQKGKGAGLFYCQGSPLSVAFGEGWVAYDYRPGGDEGVLFRMSCDGGNDVTPIGRGVRTHVENHFKGSDPEGWVTRARTFDSVEYPNIYDGIDLVIYSKGGRMKYDLIISPGSDPDQIMLSYTGIERLAIDPTTGNLLIDTALGTVVDQAPYTYQMQGEKRRVVESGYRLIDMDTVTFDVGSHVESLPLVIDPDLSLSTVIGGRVKTTDVEVDAEGNIYLFGTTYTQDFPTTIGAYSVNSNGGRDLFISKFKPDGRNLIFSTYFGGIYDDRSCESLLDINGSITFSGTTRSDDIPTTQGVSQPDRTGGQEVFVAKLSKDGSDLVFCTYLGGSGDERVLGITEGINGEIFVHGSTAATNFPTTSGSYDPTWNRGLSDGFIAKISWDAKELLASTYFGGRQGDPINDLVTTKGGDIIFGGYTWSPDFPTTAGAYSSTISGAWDSFVARMDSDLTTLKKCTLIGGGDLDYADYLLLDDDENVIFGGRTISGNYPTTTDAYDSTYGGGYFDDTVITKLNASFDKLLYSTYFGGAEPDHNAGLHLMENGSILFSISTRSNSLPVTQDAYDDTHNGHFDIYIGMLDQTGGSIEYGTYFGGAAVDKKPPGLLVINDTLYLAGFTNSSDFPTTQGSYCTTVANQSAFISTFKIGNITGTPPSPPLNVTAVQGDRSVLLSWEPPSDTSNLTIRTYRIHRGLTPTNLTQRATCARTELSYIDDRLSPGTTYYFAVSAVTFLGEGNRSTPVNVTIVGSPRAPRDLGAAPGDTNITLTWSAPTDMGNLPLTGYLLLRGPSELDLELLVELGNVTYYLDEGLENGKEYFYAVLARNPMWNGTSSGIVSAIPVGLPSAPRYLRIAFGNSQASLEWRAPEDSGGEPVIGYHVHRGTTEDTLVQVGTVNHTIKYTNDGLTNGQTYFYAVQAFNRVGEGPLSEVISGMPVGLPGVPVAFNVELNDRSVTLSWDPPESDGGTPLTGYGVFRGPSDGELVSLTKLGASVTTHTDTGLDNGQTYYYAVCAINRLGEGPWTDVLSAVPLTLPDPPDDVIALADNGTVTISWLRPQDNGGAEIERYTIYRGTSEDSLEPVVNVTRAPLIYDDRDVVAGTTYHYAVAAVTVKGEGPRSLVASATPYGPPGSPTGLVATPGDREVRLTWSAPEDDGASAIVGYMVMRGDSPSNLREIAQLGDVTSYLDTSVTNGQTYHYVVVALNEAGPGEHTEAVSATPLRMATPPGKVLTLAVDAKGTKVTLQWTAPMEDGGSPVTGYVILRGLTAGNLERVAEVVPGVTTWSEDGLERGTTYYYSVAAKNDVGEGEAILAREVKVPGAKEEGPGFEIVLVLASMAIIAPIIARRRGAR